MEKLNVAHLNLEGKIKTLEDIFDNMHVKASGLGTTGFMLGGDTGVGKTSFIKDLAAMLGLRLIIIETPHIVEEHIIDIPFIVVAPAAQQAKTQHMMVDTKGSQKQFDIKFAKSNLHTALTAAVKESDAALLSSIQKRDDLFQIWKQLGGSASRIPSEIAAIRKKYDCILFLDEYFRQTSNTIRNMLRSILNGRIGSNDLPANVYVIFASNLVDQGVGEILENEDFHLLNFDKPSVDDWFAYMLAKYKTGKVTLDKDLVNGMYGLLKKHDALSYDDPDADVRVSPRRWEQLMVYISANLPPKDQQAADLLMKNVEVSFKNYQTGEKAKLAKDVEKLVESIIEKQSGKKIQASASNVDDADWRSTLKHQLETRIEAGEARKYIPVIGGLPGSGKTTHIAQLALELNLVPVFIDVQNLSAEEVIGTPLAETDKDDSINVTFSRPPLYDEITKKIKAGEARLPGALEKAYGKDEAEKRIAEYKKQDVKYLIFFDELNRTNTKVFNAIRKVLLEKEFNDEYRLPKEAVLVAAVNPVGKGTQELTKHVRDVFDVIPVGISWNKFSSHLNKVQADAVDRLGVQPEVAEISRGALNAFVDSFRVKGAKREQGADPHFYLQIGPTPLYMSAREYTNAFTKMMMATQRALSKELDLLEDPDHDAGESELRIREAMARAFIQSVNYTVGVKHGMDSPEFSKDLEEWFKYTDKFSLGSMFKKKVSSIKSLAEILAKPFENEKEDLFNDLEFVNYLTSVDPTVFKEELSEFLSNYVITDFKKAFETTHHLKTLDAKKKMTTVEKEEVSKIEFITREILHAIKLHDISNKMLEMVKVALREMLERIAEENTDAIEQVMDFAHTMQAFIKKM